MTPTFRQILDNPIHFLAFGFGAGLLPNAPGTYGTLLAIPIVFFLKHFSWVTYIVFFIATFLIGIHICQKTSQDIKQYDHPGIVWDEVVGFILAMFLVPFEWYWLLLGFVLFRFFDIKKPWPIKTLETQVKGGLGIMVDDLAAGLYTFLILQILIFLTNL